MKLLDRLRERFKNPEYRRAYVDSFSDSFLATQIKVLREQRKLTQHELADRAGVRQSQVSKWENANNSSWQIRTLKNLARALDLVLVVRFESFGRMVPEIESFGREALERPSFGDDPVFNSAEVEATIGVVTEEDYQDMTAVPDRLPVFAAMLSSVNYSFDRGQRRVA